MFAIGTSQDSWPLRYRIRRERSRLVIAEDDDDVRAVLGDFFIQDGFEVTLVPDGERLARHLEMCRDRRRLPNTIILDHAMPGRTGLEILTSMKEYGWTLPVILVTAFGTDIVEAARSLGACAAFQKPFDLDDLRSSVCFWSARQREFDDWSKTDMPEAPACAGCGTTTAVRLHPPFIGMYYCEDCRQREESGWQSGSRLRAVEELPSGEIPVPLAVGSRSRKS